MPRRPEGQEPSARDHSRDRKECVCRGCGGVFSAYALHAHEAACRRSRVLPGTRFHITTTTYVGGKNGQRVRRPIEVEVIRRQGSGWLVRALVSKRELSIGNPRRFHEWNASAPGLKETAA